MKIIKGFENEDIVVSDFGEWVGKDYIDYKAEYKRNQKFIEILLDENQKQKEAINKVNKYIKKHSFFVIDTWYNKKIGYPKDTFSTQEILDILKEVSE